MGDEHQLQVEHLSKTLWATSLAAGPRSIARLKRDRATEPMLSPPISARDTSVAGRSRDWSPRDKSRRSRPWENAHPQAPPRSAPADNQPRAKTPPAAAPE